MTQGTLSKQRLLTVIPVWNGEKYIGEALSSIAAQTRRPDRVIVLDNRSTDGTREIVARFGRLCEWQQNETNLGLFGNLNKALDFSRDTDFLHILHADDLILPEFYERVLSAPAKPDARALIYCQSDLIDEAGKVVCDAGSGSNSSPRRLPLKHFLRRRAELAPFYFPGVVLKTAFKEVPVRFRLDMPQLADQVFWAQWAAECRHVVELGRALSRYRTHGGSGTAANMKDLQAWVLDEHKVMRMVDSLVPQSQFSRWFRHHKLLLMFAARSQVKIRQVSHVAPEFAVAIRKETEHITGHLHWLVARGVVAVLR